MTTPVKPDFVPSNPDLLASQQGKIAVLVDGDGPRTIAARRLDRLMRGALSRFMHSDAFSKLKPGEAADLSWPAGLAAEVVQVVRLPRRASLTEARKAGGSIGRSVPKDGCLVLADGHLRAADVAFGLTLRAYDFADHKTGEKKDIGPVTVMVTAPDAVRAAYAECAALAEGVFFTRDLVNEPSNVLTTTEFAKRLKELAKLGVEVEVLEEKDLAKLGMRLLLGVGVGSDRRPRSWSCSGRAGPTRRRWRWSARAWSLTPAASRSSRRAGWKT